MKPVAPPFLKEHRQRKALEFVGDSEEKPTVPPVSKRANNLGWPKLNEYN
jgi:hypothetical protein